MNKIKSLIFYLLFWITPVIHGLSIGIQVPPSLEGSTDLLTEINSIHEELYSLNNVVRNGWGGRSYKNNIEKIRSLHKQIEISVNNYLLKNTCLRYYLTEYISFDELKSHRDKGFLVSLNFKINGINDQILNLNILDKDANTLRRISKIKERNLNVLIQYPLNEKTEEFYAEQYFDLCFENFKHDKSWSAKISLLEVYLELAFGIETISQKYQDSTTLLSQVNDELDKIYREVEAVSNDIVKSLKTSEPELRNRNENNLTTYMVLIIIICVIYVIVNFTQIYWLIKYLKNKKLIH